MKMLSIRVIGPVVLTLYHDWRAFGLGFRVRRYTSWFATASLGPLLLTIEPAYTPPPARGPHSSHDDTA